MLKMTICGSYIPAIYIRNLKLTLKLEMLPFIKTHNPINYKLTVVISYTYIKYDVYYYD